MTDDHGNTVVPTEIDLATCMELEMSGAVGLIYALAGELRPNNPDQPVRVENLAVDPYRLAMVVDAWLKSGQLKSTEGLLVRHVVSLARIEGVPLEFGPFDQTKEQQR